MSRAGLVALALLSVSAMPAPNPATTTRAAAAAAVYPGVLARYRAGAAPVDEVYTWSLRTWEAERDSGNPAAGSGHVARMRALADEVHARVLSGAAPTADELAVAYYLADAEFRSTR